MITNLIIKDFECVPKRARDFFPNPIDGYLYLVESENGNGFECRRFMYGDSHPWKDYRDSDSFVESLTKEVGLNLSASVESWNEQARRKQEQAAAERLTNQTRFESWLSTLPDEIYGFRREGSELFDQYRNEMFSLAGCQFAFKGLDEIESIIQEIMEDGGFE